MTVCGRACVCTCARALVLLWPPLVFYQHFMAQAFHWTAFSGLFMRACCSSRPAAHQESAVNGQTALTAPLFLPGVKGGTASRELSGPEQQHLVLHQRPNTSI